MFRFDSAAAAPTDRFGTHEAGMARGVRFHGEAQIGCFHIEPGGVIGYHEAAVSQLFMCVSGDGWIRGEEERRSAIHPGQATFWIAGENHESGSETGMVAIVVEGRQVDPTGFMPEVIFESADDGA